MLSFEILSWVKNKLVNKYTSVIVILEILLTQIMISEARAGSRKKNSQSRSRNPCQQAQGIAQAVFFNRPVEISSYSSVEE